MNDTPPLPAPPQANRIPRRLEVHGHVREDPYYWLNQRDDPEVRAYLAEENAYASAVMAHTEGLQTTLFEEITGRIDPDEDSVPARKSDYLYYHRYEKGKEYAIHCRKHGSLDSEEVVLVDGNALAEGHDFFSLRISGVSPDHRKLAYAVDTEGRRIYTIHFKDLVTGEVLEDELTSATGGLAWAADNETVFYARQHPETLRSYQIYRHRLGSDAASDVLVYEETDETFHVYVYGTKSERYVIVSSDQTVSSEVRFVPTDAPESEFTVVSPRQRDHEYAVSHFGDHFYILTNLDAQNFRLVKTKVASTGVENWEEVIPHRPDVLLEGFSIFRDYLVVVERSEGLRSLRVIPWNGSEEHEVSFDEPVYHVNLEGNLAGIDTHVLRFGYTSLTTPHSTYDYDMRTRERTLLKRDRVVGDFNPERYQADRLEAVAKDGTRIPISLVYRSDLRRGPAPLVLYGYGSYGISMESTFSSARLSLLDRGFIYAIAHIRGGEELGRGWYEQGKLLEKRNTFTDFISCAEHLGATGYADPQKLVAWGGSAGGLLVGAVINDRPDLFAAAVAQVPFVDIVTTMLDESIPLTTGEFDEWGNPAEEEYYRYMLSYSPYDNVVAQEYPHLLVMAGLYDSQVQYWEPAKWVAKLRATKTNDHLVLLKTNMDAGHGGASGRFRRYRETAFAYAFLIDLIGG